MRQFRPAEVDRASHTVTAAVTELMRGRIDDFDDDRDQSRGPVGMLTWLSLNSLGTGSR